MTYVPSTRFGRGVHFISKVPRLSKLSCYGLVGHMKRVTTTWAFFLVGCSYWALGPSPLCGLNLSFLISSYHDKLKRDWYALWFRNPLSPYKIYILEKPKYNKGITNLGTQQDKRCEQTNTTTKLTNPDTHTKMYERVSITIFILLVDP